MAQVGAYLAGATKMVLSKLEELGCKVSQDKRELLASSPAVASLVAKFSGSQAFPVTDCVKNLGG